MEVVERQIKMLTTEGGNCPFADWFEKLSDLKAVAKIEARLTRVETGNLGACEPVGEGVSELKIDYGPGYRVYFAEVGKVIIVLLGGGDKSTQSKDIKKAQDLWRKFANDPERFQRDLRA